MTLAEQENNLEIFSSSDLFPSSKIRNKHGQLVLCYHGSSMQNPDFNKTPTIWVSPSKFFAEGYGNYIKKVYVNISRPLQIRDHSEPIGELAEANSFKPSIEFKYLVNKLQLSPNKVLQLLKQYYKAHREDFEDFADMACWTLWFIPEIIAQVKALGYDGLVGKELNTSVCAVFNVNQLYFIKPVLKEDTRNMLVSKSRNTGGYKDTSRGKNRFERKKYSKIARTVRQYNQINMNNLFKSDLLQVEIPVTGETDNYTVSIKMDGVIAEIQKNIKNHNNKFEFRTVLQALTKVFNTTNIYVKCTCDDYKYNYAHWNIVNKVSTDDTAHDPGPGKGIKNPNDTKGRGCKHVLLVLANGDWLMKVASVINNYVHYAEEHLQKPFLKLIFPKLYGIEAEDAVEEDLVDDDKYLDSSSGFIDAINEYGRNRGKIKKGSNKNPVAEKEQNKSATKV